MNKVKVLAVGDPAVYAYKDDKFQVLKSWEDRVEFNIVPWNEYYENMIEAFEGKKEYDIVMVAGHLWLKDFVHKGYLAEVSNDLNEEYDFEDILPVIRKELEIDNKRYLYPSFCDGHILLYRKSVVRDLLNKELNEVVSTDEIIELARICHGYNGINGIALKAHESEIFLDFLPYLRNEGIDAFEEESHRPIFNCLKGENALKKYKSLKAFSPINTNTYGNEEIRKAFQNKEVALAVTWGGQLGFVLTEECKEIEDVGFAALKTAWNVTWSFGINAKSNNKKLSEEFLKYLTSKNIDKIVGGYAGSPVRKSTYVEDGNKYNWYNVHLKLIEKYAKPLPSMLNAGDKTGALYKCVADVFNDKVEIKMALEKAMEV